MASKNTDTVRINIGPEIPLDEVLNNHQGKLTVNEINPFI